MRLWPLHPKYLDPKGLVTLWRETLLARAVLQGNTRGYRHHPQLERFRRVPASLLTLNAYLRAIYEESQARGYKFDRRKLGPMRSGSRLVETSGQLEFEWGHLLRKLERRNPDLCVRLRSIERVEPHPLFCIEPGPIAEWERHVAENSG